MRAVAPGPDWDGYWYAAAYLLVNLGLSAVALTHGNPSNWQLRMALGWGLGLLLHGLSVWVLGPGSDVTERLVGRERARLQRQGARHSR